MHLSISGLHLLSCRSGSRMVAVPLNGYFCNYDSTGMQALFSVFSAANLGAYYVFRSIVGASNYTCRAQFRLLQHGFLFQLFLSLPACV
jgi:hypothetical protein